MTYSEWISTCLTGKEPTKQSLRKPHGRHPGSKARTQQYAHCCSCLESDFTILVMSNALHMTSCHKKPTDQACLPFKTVLRKLRDRYQSNCTTYKTHAMTTHHGGVGHAGKDRDLDSHMEDTGNRSETMIPFGGLEADGCISNLSLNSQPDLHILAREIHSLQQHTETREGQPSEGLNHIDCLEQELRTLSLILSMQPSSTSTLTEPFGEVVHQYTDTLCTKKKTNTPYQLPTTGHCHLQ